MTFYRCHLDIALIEVSMSEVSSEEIYTDIRQIDLNTNIFIFMGDETAANARSLSRCVYRTQALFNLRTDCNR